MCSRSRSMLAESCTTTPTSPSLLSIIHLTRQSEMPFFCLNQDYRAAQHAAWRIGALSSGALSTVHTKVHIATLCTHCMQLPTALYLQYSCPICSLQTALHIDCTGLGYCIIKGHFTIVPNKEPPVLWVLLFRNADSRAMGQPTRTC